MPTMTNTKATPNKAKRGATRVRRDGSPALMMPAEKETTMRMFFYHPSDAADYLRGEGSRSGGYYTRSVIKPGEREYTERLLSDDGKHPRVLWPYYGRTNDAVRAMRGLPCALTAYVPLRSLNSRINSRVGGDGRVSRKAQPHGRCLVARYWPDLKSWVATVCEFPPMADPRAPPRPISKPVASMKDFYARIDRAERTEAAK